MATITTKETREFSWATADLSKLKVGDEITEELKNGDTVTLVCVDEGVIGLKDCLGAEWPMNEEWTNMGGWLASDMRRYLNEEIFQLLPDELRTVIKPRTFGKEEDMLWLFSEFEVFGKHIWSQHEEGEGEKHFEYFKNPANRAKRDADNAFWWWWERSPSATNSTSFCQVLGDGIADANGASYPRGICFGFLI